MRRIVFALLLVLMAAPGTALAFDHTYRLWNSDLAQFNESGYVHYGAWKRNHERLDRYIADMKDVGLREFGGWTPEQRTAFWINAHNALVIARIIEAYPRVDEQRERHWLVAGQDVTTDDIRDKILRGTESRVPLLSEALGRDTSIAAGRDLRILFAICEGSTVSPPLSESAYTGDGLSAQLDRQVSRTLANPSFLEVEPRLKIFRVAGFFRIYQRDFKTYQGHVLLFEKSGSGDRGLLRFVFPYLDKPMQDVLLAKQKARWRVEYRMPSDALNGGD